MIIYISEQFKKKINILIFPFSPVTLIIPEEILHYNISSTVTYGAQGKQV